jgi:hypothetical protein
VTLGADYSEDPEVTKKLFELKASRSEEEYIYDLQTNSSAEKKW